MAEAKKKYIVKEGARVRHDGKLYAAAEEVSLTAKQYADVKAYVVAKPEETKQTTAKTTKAKPDETKPDETKPEETK